MEAYDALNFEVVRLLKENRVEESLQVAIESCRHRGPEPEPVNLRDARSDMLTKVIMYKIHAGAGDEVLDAAEGGLLDRRLFGWLYGSAEIKRFPLSAGEDMTAASMRRARCHCLSTFEASRRVPPPSNT